VRRASSFSPGSFTYRHETMVTLISDADEAPRSRALIAFHSLAGTFAVPDEFEGSSLPPILKTAVAR